MARIQPARARGMRVKLICYFTRRSLAKLSGRQPERMLEPLQMVAHSPALLNAYAKLEQATAKLRQVDKRLSDLAELKAATMTSCEYCIDLGSQVARHRSGLTDEQLLALPRYRDSQLFTELEKLVLDYAVGMSRTPVDVPDELFARLREQFGDAQLVELTYHIALENLRGRFNLALGIGPAGFSDGMVCAVPGSIERTE
jgi:4-carboxymuconolactone decarboxylase